MKISFDLDDTIFMSSGSAKTEKPLPFPINMVFKERLRYGTISLFNYIREQNIELWIYTTSFRSEKYIKNFFRCYGLKIDYVINGYRHMKEVQGNKLEVMPSKCPNRYHIDLHIDDEISVAQNGEIYGFKVLIIDRQDDEWDKKVIQAIGAVRKLE